MTYEFAIDGLLCWLPPIYKDIVIGYAMQGESFTFHGLRTQWRAVKVELVAGKLSNAKGYIWYTNYKCFMLNTYSRFLCIWHRFTFIRKQELLRKNCMKELMVRDNGNQDIDGHERCTSRFFIRISDKIKFMISNGWGPYLCFLLYVRQSYGHIMIMNSLF
jgi:hypothetical protein